MTHQDRICLAVIVVEDEALIRMATSEFLRDEGFTVYEAASTSDALVILEGSTSVDAIFTDIEMPGQMNGLSLAWRVASGWPSIAIVVTSGRTFPNMSELPARAIFIAKPYGLAELGGLARFLRHKN